jgi:hypothetical protein
VGDQLRLRQAGQWDLPLSNRPQQQHQHQHQHQQQQQQQQQRRLQTGMVSQPSSGTPRGSPSEGTLGG